MRSFNVSRKLVISDCRLPIADLRHRVPDSVSIGNRQSKIGNAKAPRCNNAGPLFKPDFLAAVERLAELFSGFFYVAASRFNSPRFCQAY
jgi:hypothetical protein